MRFNNKIGTPLSVWLENASEEQIRDILYKYGDEKHAKLISNAIVKNKIKNKITTTTQLSERINSMQTSQTLAMAAKARELRAEGKDIIGLSLGEPDFNTPDFIKEAAIRAIEENYHSYPPVDGYLELKKAICEKFKRDNGLNYEPSQIVVSTGAKQSIANVCMALLNKGDEVLLPAPYWVSYSAIVSLSEAKFKIIPTSMEFVDIAGLVEGASKGEGLGNQFLTNIRETEAIVHVVRAFENEDIVHVSGKVSPKDDIEIINTELVLADLNTVENLYQKAIKGTKAGQKEGLPLKDLLEKILPVLEEGKSLRTVSFNEEEQKLLKGFQLLTIKPVLYVANVNEDGFESNPFLNQIYDLANEEGSEVVAICAELEAEISGLPNEEKIEFLKELGLEESGLDRLTMAGYKLLGLQTYFTAGEKEVRAWTINVGDSAPKAAGKIHTDFERGFIRAETVTFDDYIQNNGEKGSKEAGKLRSEGKEYIVKDGDVIHFLFSV